MLLLLLILSGCVSLKRQHRDELMSINYGDDGAWFWSFIERHKDLEGEEQYKAVRSDLMGLDREDLLRFDRVYGRVYDSLNTWDAYGAACLASGGARSEEFFMDFRGWIIFQGKDVVYSILTDPDCLADFLLYRRRDISSPEYLFLSSKVYKERFGSDTPLTSALHHGLSGREWEDEEELRTRFPSLWHNYLTISNLIDRGE